MTIYPKTAWQNADPVDVNMNPQELARTKNWLEATVGDTACRQVIIRRGYLVSEWNYNLAREEQVRLASATKSIYSCMLAIAIADGKLSSADEKVVDHYPEMMEPPENGGPKPGRYPFEKDREITFRQLISNTSGYMKPNETPGRVFHYQTYGMNILIHALAKLYGLYDISDPEGSPGLRSLIDDRIKQPIGGNWDYYLMNFELQSTARLDIFGYFEGAAINALDMARLGWLWLNWGRWEDQQLVPEAWLREASQTAPDIKANCPETDWQYGYGFWTNSDGQLFPGMSKDIYMAAGAGNQYIWVCPSLELVIVQSPGLRYRLDDSFSDFFARTVDACKE